MSQLYDIQGNAVRALDALGNEVLTDTRPQTAAVAALNAEVAIDCAGEHTVYVVITGGATATLSAEASGDNTNYIPLPVWNPQTELFTTGITSNGSFQFDIPAGAKRVRLRCSAYTSGTFTVQMRATKAVDFLYAKDIPATSAVTNTGAAAAAVTLTLAAPGANLFHYITHLTIERHTSALLTAGATPIVVTSTNLPGSMAWSFPADAAAQGVMSAKYFDFSKPVKSSAANTATTIVCPGTTGVIWRATAHYYVGA